MATRSNVFTYSILVLLALEAYVRKPTLISAIVSGLLLSTRSVFVVVYLIYYVTELRGTQVGRWRFLGYSAIAAISFLLTFLPFLWIWPDKFWRMNPFIVQSTFLVPLGISIGFVIVALLTSLLVRKDSVVFASGILLWFCIAVYACYHIADRGWLEAIDDSVVDISYFLFSMPFLGFYWLSNNRDQADIPPRWQ